MLNSALNSSFVGRLKEIINSRYGKGLQIRQLMDLAESQTGDFFTKGQDLHIPIKVNGTWLGSAVIPSADDLSQENMTGITQLVRMVLEPALYKWHLDQKELNLVSLKNSQHELSELDNFQASILSLEDPINVEKISTTNDGIAEDLISHLIHLEGKSANNNKKVALLLHELAGRWAFVPFNDIKGHLHTVHDFPKLGSMTIYVENIEDISPKEQSLLLEYISIEHSFDEPIIITSTAKDLQELTNWSVQTDLADELSINCFDVDRAPLNNESLKDILELFFFREAPLDA